MTSSAASDLVGRQSLLAELDRARAELRAGRGRAVLIEGEPGIGKSALLDAWLASATGEVEVRRGACDELLNRFPLAAAREALRGDLASRAGSPSDDASADDAPESAGSAAGWSGPAPIGDPVVAATEQLAATVDRLCSHSPLIFVLDDLHWADEAGLALWRWLTRSTVQIPLLLVGACRAVPAREELLALRRETRSADGLLLSLPSLAEAEVSELARRIAGARPGPGLARRLEAASGNPLYVTELLYALDQGGLVAVGSGVAELKAPTARGEHAADEVTASLAASIAARIDFLTADARTVLRAATLLGGEFSVADLAALMDRSAMALTEVVVEGLSARILESVGTRLRFRHGLLRQALYETIPTPLRSVMHLQAARVLLDADAGLGRVADMLLAAPDAIAGWALDWVADYAGELVKQVPPIGMELLEVALERLGPDDPRRAVLTDHQLTVSLSMWSFARTEQLARTVIRESRDFARVNHAAWLLAYSYLTLDRLDEAETLVRTRMRDAVHDPLWNGRLLALFSMVLQRLGRYEESAETARTACELGDAQGDAMALGYGLLSQAALKQYRGEEAGALELLEAALEVVGTDPSLISLRITLLNNRSAGMLNFERFDESAEALGEARRICEVFGISRISAIRVRSAELQFTLGRWDDAWAELDLATDLPSGKVAMVRTGLMALIAVHRDERRQAAGLLRRVDELAAAGTNPNGDPADGTYALLARALTRYQDGDPSAAVRTLEAVLNPRFLEYSGDVTWLLTELARLAVATDHPKLAETAAAEAVRAVHADATPGERAQAAWCRALVDGDPGPVLAAADHFRAVGSRYSLAPALEDAAALQAAKDPAAARATLEQALAVYTEMGATWDVRHAASRLRTLGVRLGVRGPRGRPSSGWAALTRTELSVAELVAQGRSNPDIAERLVLSRRTVESHVSHILTKLQARSRREVAELAPPDVFQL